MMKKPAVAALVFCFNLSIVIAGGIPLPVIPPAVFNVTNYGAVGDGKTLNTAAIQKTIDTASKAGGGMVLIPAGNFLTAPFTLASSIDLHLATNATLLISDDMANYPVQEKRYIDSITVSGAHDVKISGPGTIDGQGKVWWEGFHKHKTSMPHRPYLIKISNCERLQVEGVTLKNSPMFHLVPKNCTDVTIDGITITAPADAPNTDGIDPSGWNFLITNCHIDTGDDNIAIKPLTDRNPGNKNFLVSNCTFLHGHGCSVGGGTLGGLDGLTVSNCTFNGTDSGIRIKTPRGNGGVLQNVVYENLTITDVKHPIYINDYYPESTAPKDPATETAQPVTDRTPVNKNIIIRNVTISNCKSAGAIRGLPEMPIESVTFSNVTISAKSALIITHARGVRFENSTVEAGGKKEKVTAFDADISGLK